MIDKNPLLIIFFVENTRQRVHWAQKPYPSKRTANGAPLSSTINILDTTQSNIHKYSPAMDQSAMGNLAAPLPFPELRKGLNGWSGKCDEFRVVDNVINIKISDGDSNRSPSQEQRELRIDSEGVFSQHVLLSQDHDLYQLWMRKIGPYLGDWVLERGRHGTSI